MRFWINSVMVNSICNLLNCFSFFYILFIFMIKSVYSSGCPWNSHASFPGLLNVRLKPLHYHSCFNLSDGFHFILILHIFLTDILAHFDLLKVSVCLFLGYERFIFSFSCVDFYRDIKITWNKIFNTFYM